MSQDAHDDASTVINAAPAARTGWRGDLGARGGCSVDTSNEASMESVGQTKDDLSVYRWSAASHAADNHSYDPASIATFSNNESDLTIMVNASTMSWDHDFQLPYYSSTSPALASYNGSLYIIGSTSSTRQLWQATMSTSEVFSPASTIPGQFADVPSLAVHCASTFCFPATLYMAYKSSAGEVIMSGLQATFSRRGVNTTWGRLGS